MSRRLYIFVIVGTGLLVVALGLWFFLWLGSQPSNTEPDSGGIFGGFFGGRTPGSEQRPPLSGEGEGENSAQQKLFLIHDKPIAGFVVYEQASTTRVRFTEKETGHVYTFSPATGEKVRETNTTVPAIAEAIWAPDGSAVVLRYLEDERVRNAVGLLPATTTGSFAAVSFLEDNAYDITFSPTSRELFYLRKEGSAAQGLVMRKEGGNRRTVFSSPLTEWSAQWATENALYLVQDVGLGGGLGYRINPRTAAATLFGVHEPVASLKAGSTTIIAAPLTGGDAGNLDLFTVENGFRGELFLPTASEKCSFAPKAAHVLYCASPSENSESLTERLTLWYQGLLSTDDELYRLDTRARALSPLSFKKEAGDRLFDIDMIGVSPLEDTLALRNKTDGLLWGYRLK